MPRSTEERRRGELRKNTDEGVEQEGRGSRAQKCSGDRKRGRRRRRVRMVPLPAPPALLRAAAGGRRGPARTSGSIQRPPEVACGRRKAHATCS
eukprot:4741558-Pyramimonas_sp.AAC.1